MRPLKPAWFSAMISRAREVAGLLWESVSVTLSWLLVLGPQSLFLNDCAVSMVSEGRSDNSCLQMCPSCCFVNDAELSSYF
jgi:hypothetical protein